MSTLARQISDKELTHVEGEIVGEFDGIAVGFILGDSVGLIVGD